MFSDAQSIIKEIKQKSFVSLYFLYGEEAFFIDQIIAVAESEILEENERAFNQVVYYGKDILVSDIENAARQLPLMADRRVVIIKEAQAIRDIEGLENYIINPNPETVLFIAYKSRKIDSRKKFFKLIKEKHLLFHAKSIKEYKLANWIREYITKSGFKINVNSAQMLADYLGNDLQKITNEIEKATFDLEKGEELSASRIRYRIGVSKEYNIFELQKSLGLKKIQQAILITRNMAQNMKTNPLTMICTMLYRYFSQVFVVIQNRNNSDTVLAKKLRVNPYFIKDFKIAIGQYNHQQLVAIFDILKEYDLRSKGVGSRNSFSDSDLFEEMVVRILHA